MASVARHAAAALLLAPLVIVPGVQSAAAAPTEPGAPTAPVAPAEPASPVDASVPSAPPVPGAVSLPKSMPKAPATPTKKRPLRWREYFTQKPKWSATTCTSDMRDVVADVEDQLGEQVAVECARVATPIDWTNLPKGSMTLQVSRVKRIAKKGAPPARALFVNPGGPGMPVDQIVPLTPVLKPALRTTHDVIGIDPRGTGASTPLACTPPRDGVADYRKTTAANRRAVQKALKASVDACVKKYGAYLPHITTANTAHDHDMVRQIMGYRTADWYGVSGGSWLGATYAQLHPKTVGRFVLDANTQFTADWRTSFSTMPMAMQRRFDRQFLPWVARHNKQYGLGTRTVVAKESYERIRSAASRGRIKGLTANDLDAVTVQTMYEDASFPDYARALSQLNTQLRKHGRAAWASQPMTKQQALQTAAISTVRTAIICNDTRGGSARSYEAESLRLGKQYPLWGYGFIQVGGPCAYWPYKPKPRPAINGVGVPTMLMTQNEFDPATSTEGARQAHRANRATRMLTVDDAGGHGAFFSSTENACVDKAVLAFLQKGTLPRTDLMCPGKPLPDEKKVYPVRLG